ncbi:hypothetical protein [Amphibacillus cookii]|uniref:hypothetical protein n=1 Tax=Amphibacillus cookii TaxID=767787 RepID=UPI00195CD4DA|nr:hypothetical protein [Amphibacillus cookii]MBM7542337.1 hypothetical protein [Amphibacillus cookii]
MWLKSSKKSIVRLLLTGLIVVTSLSLFPNTSSAASFSFTISPPFAGSLVSSSLVTKTSTSTPYVSPSHSATPTHYFLSPQRGSSTQATGLVTNISTAGRRNLSYLSGYGGTNQRYCLSAYPSNTSFVRYSVSGTWAP